MLIWIVKRIIVIAAYIFGAVVSTTIRLIVWAFGPRVLEQAFLEILNSARVERFALEMGQAGALQGVRMLMAARMTSNARQVAIDLDGEIGDVFVGAKSTQCPVCFRCTCGQADCTNQCRCQPQTSPTPTSCDAGNDSPVSPASR